MSIFSQDNDLRVENLTRDLSNSKLKYSKMNFDVMFMIKITVYLDYI
jgi:hypothetical protein